MTTEAPNWLPVKPENIPADLKARDQWVAWRPVCRDGKWTKVPINIRSGREAKSDTPATWAPFDAALAYASAHPWNGNGRGVAGVGYVLAADDPFVGVDLDKCLDPDKGIDGFAMWVMEQLASYTEVSPSGTGLRIIIKGKLPPQGRRKGTFEVYESGRFLTITGQLALEGEPNLNTVHDRQKQLDAVHARVFAPKEQTQRPLSDHDLLDRAFKSKTGRELERLMAGDITGHASASEADLALCNALAFWTGKDASRMDRIFRSSGLFRPKWDEKHFANGTTYGAATIAKAIAGTKDTFGQGQARTSSASTGDAEGYDPRREEAKINAQLDANDRKKAQLWKTAREVFPRTPFPWDVLPEDVAASFKQLARSCAGSANPLPGAAFAIIGAAVGRTLAVTPKLGWSEPAIVWHGDIRESGSGKTAPLWMMADALLKAQRAEDDRAKDDQADYDALPAKEKKNAELPKPARSYYCSDATMEGLRSALKDHPTGGVIVILSELSAIISGQNQYKRQGNDREALLCLHDGKPARIVRAGKPALSLYDARVSIIGGIQPGIFKTVFGSQAGQFLEDGTINRFLFTYEPSTHHVLTSESWSEENAIAWAKIVQAALQWADDQEGLEPVKMILSTEAQGLFFSWRNDLDATKGALPQEMRGFLAKTYGYALRLAGIINVIRRLAVGMEPAAMLDADDVRRGIKAASFYLSQAVDCMATMATEKAAPPVEVSERTQTLALTLNQLQDKTDNGRLAVGYVMDAFNAASPETQKFTAGKSFGAFLRGCGLTITEGKHDANGRKSAKCLVWNSKAEALTQTIQTKPDNDILSAGYETPATTPSADNPDKPDNVHREGDLSGDREIMREEKREGQNYYLDCLDCLESKAGSQLEDPDNRPDKKILSGLSAPSPVEGEGFPDEVEI